MSPIYQALTVTVGTFVPIISIVIIVSMSVNSKSYKYYRVTYYAIKSCSYVMVRNSFNQHTYQRVNETNPYTNDEIIFFLSGGEVDDIKLISRGSNYIHSKGGIDLYSRYWFRKILKARDKYNHELHYQRRCDDMVEDVSGNNVYFGNEPKPSFKFLRG